MKKIIFFLPFCANIMVAQQIPDNIRQDFATNNPGVNNPQWKMNGDNYQVTYNDSSNMSHNVYYGKNGTMSGTQFQVDTGKVPKGISSYYSKNYPNYKNYQVWQQEDGQGNKSYYIPGQGQTSYFDGNGNFIRTQQGNPGGMFTGGGGTNPNKLDTSGYNRKINSGNVRDTSGKKKYPDRDTSMQKKNYKKEKYAPVKKDMMKSDTTGKGRNEYNRKGNKNQSDYNKKEYNKNETMGADTSGKRKNEYGTQKKKNTGEKMNKSGKTYSDTTGMGKKNRKKQTSGHNKEYERKDTTQNKKKK